MIFFARRLAFQVLCSSFWCTTLPAQWRINLEVGSDRFWGGSEEVSGEHRSLHPYRPTFFGVGIERLGSRLGPGLQLAYSEASLGLEGADAVVAVEGIFTNISIAPEVHYRLAQVAANELRAHGGPLLEVWSLTDAPTRMRAGAQLGLSLDVPLGERFGVSVLGAAALVASPFNEDELESTYTRTGLWRRRFSLRGNYQL